MPCALIGSVSLRPGNKPRDREFTRRLDHRDSEVGNSLKGDQASRWIRHVSAFEGTERVLAQGLQNGTSVLPPCPENSHRVCFDRHLRRRQTPSNPISSAPIPQPRSPVSGKTETPKTCLCWKESCQQRYRAARLSVLPVSCRSTAGHFATPEQPDLSIPECSVGCAAEDRGAVKIRQIVCFVLAGSQDVKHWRACCAGENPKEMPCSAQSRSRPGSSCPA